jgi:hypothetical protein
MKRRGSGVDGSGCGESLGALLVAIMQEGAETDYRYV